MSDIVERLRRGHYNADLITVGGVTHDGRCLVAADEIARLRAELAEAEAVRDKLASGVLALHEAGDRATFERDAFKAEAERLREALERVECGQSGACRAYDEHGVRAALPSDDELVEKVARAITHGDPDRICYRRIGHDEFEPIGAAWTLSIDDARAAIAAMRGE